MPGHKYRQLSRISAFALLGLLLCPIPAQATYSIVAVDTVTGAIGGAGASCIDGAQIINDIIEGIGAVHTQAYYIPQNQANAHDLLADGLDPDSIIGWLAANDAEGFTSAYRQYGVVTLAGPGASAAFTGTSTNDWKGHITGPGYAIQGNILLGPEILEAMETAYLNSTGPLEEKLMAALEAADVPGADTRCMPCDKPAISAFIKVVRIGDGETPFLYEIINYTSCAENPTPLLRDKFDLWKALRFADAEKSQLSTMPTYLPANGAAAADITVIPLNYDNQPPIEGVDDAVLANSGEGLLSEIADNGDGSYSATVTSPLNPGVDTITATITAGGEVVEIGQRSALLYYLCGDANGDRSINVGDAVYVINYVFKGGIAPDPLDAGNANCDEAVNVGDAVYLINHVFKGGDPPCCP